MSGTPFDDFPGWYVSFQTAVLKQLPRPGDITWVIARDWLKNQGTLKEVLSRELVNPIIKFQVLVNRSLTPQEALAETGRSIGIGMVSRSILSALPTGQGEDVEVHFFPLKGHLLTSQYEEELSKHNLKPDPRAVIAVNRDHPFFADHYENGAQWGDDSCVLFSRHNRERGVVVRSDDYLWTYGRWLGGVLK